MAQASGASTSSRRSGGGQVTQDQTSLPYRWHDKQELLQRELEEARARTSQMEKTMRWWSDCTANWREKWSKVRSERNKAREEVRLLRSKLEASQREAGTLRREKNDLETQLAIVSQNTPVKQKKIVDSVKDALLQNLESPEKDGAPSCSMPSNEYKTFSIANLPCNLDENNFKLLEEIFGQKIDLSEKIASYNCSASKPVNSGNSAQNLLSHEYLSEDAEREIQCDILSFKENDVEEKLCNNLVESESGSHTSSSPHRISNLHSNVLPGSCSVNKRASATSNQTNEGGCSDSSESGCLELIKNPENIHQGRRSWKGSNGILIIDDSSTITPEQESLEQLVTMLRLRLDEGTKTIQIEREEKASLHRDISKLQAEITELHSRMDDLRISRQEAVKELVALRSHHQNEVQSLQMVMMDKASTRECIDRRLADLRAELERLQEENAAEWGKRERLESEKLNLERENKKLRSRIKDLEDRLDKRSKMSTVSSDSSIASLKQELIDKTKELSELKHAHSKLKKVLNDKSIDLQHNTRRADQYESEVKRLRGRVEELKKELAAAEDEVDNVTNNSRKLQRTNDELQEKVENLEVQVEHLQSRLRSSQNATSIPLHSACGLLRDSDDDGQGEF